MSNDIQLPSTAFSGGVLFDWSSGTPRTRDHNQAMAKEQAAAVFSAVAALPYKGEWDAEQQTFVVKNPDWVGLTLHEVMAIVLAEKGCQGDLAAIKEFMDRFLGRAKQQVEALNVNLTLSEYLKQLDLDEEEGSAIIDVAPDEEAEIQRMLDEV